MSKLDLQKHKLLGILVGKTLKFDSDLLPNDEPFGVSFEEILSRMNCDIIKLNLIAAELYAMKEIDFYDIETMGMCCIENGKVSYSTNKYKNRYYDRIGNYLKAFFQIVIPTLALLVALYSVTNDIKSGNEEINTQLQEIQVQIELQQKSIDQLKADSTTLHLLNR